MRLTGMVLFAAPLFAASALAQAPTPVDALDGVDPVVLLQQGKEVFGKSEHAVVRGRFRYLFSSGDTKTVFEREPGRYEIQLGGLCARMGKSATGNPSDYLVHDGKIYIFGSDDCRKRFAAAPQKYLAPAAPAMPDAPEAIQKARGLLDRLAAATGGERLARLTSYAETASQVQTRMDREVTVTTKTTWRFPGEVRLDRSMNMNGTPMTFSTVITADAAWNVATQGRIFPVPDVARPGLELDLGRHPIAILVARRTPAFNAAALGSSTVAGTAVERVRVRHGGVDVVLGIEPSGRLYSLEFADRNMEGEVGTYTLIYSDFRNEGGLLVPHAMRSLFNGQPDDFQTWTIQTVEVDPTIDAALFARPAGGGR